MKKRKYTKTGYGRNPRAVPARMVKGQGIYRNPKTVLRIMKKYEVLAEIRRPRKWRQMGQQVHKYENLLNREFHADKPNTKSHICRT